jgi:hypothetical protein
MHASDIHLSSQHSCQIQLAQKKTKSPPITIPPLNKHHCSKISRELILDIPGVEGTDLRTKHTNSLKQARTPHGTFGAVAHLSATPQLVSNHALGVQLKHEKLQRFA